ncbi:MAG: FHA domain-containing protein [Myxococcota bacterium]
MGRSPTADITVQSELVSGHHAVVHWSDGAWHARDLGSRNGTFVDGERIPTGQGCRLRAGQSLIAPPNVLPWRRPVTHGARSRRRFARRSSRRARESERRRLASDHRTRQRLLEHRRCGRTAGQRDVVGAGHWGRTALMEWPTTGGRHAFPPPTHRRVNVIGSPFATLSVTLVSSSSLCPGRRCP